MIDTNSHYYNFFFGYSQLHTKSFFLSQNVDVNKVYIFPPAKPRDTPPNQKLEVM